MSETRQAPASAVAQQERGPDRRARLLRRAVTAGPVLALVVLVVAFSVLSPRFGTVGNAQNVLDQAAILLVLALGVTFVVLLGGIDLSLEGVMATSSLVVVLLATNDRNGMDLGYVAVLAGVLTGTLFGLANGVLTTALRIPSFMVTLGTGAIGIGTATVLFEGRAPRMLDPELRSWGQDKALGVSLLVFVAALVLLVTYLLQRYTRMGRYAYVIGGDEQIARLSGISIARYKILGYTLSGTTAGLAGVMAASRLGVGEVQIGSGLLFTAITAVVLGGTVLAGGRGGVLHTLVGALLISVLANGLILVGVPATVQQSVQGVVVIVAVAATGWHLRSRTRVVK